MKAGHKPTYDCIKALLETDFTEDLKKLSADSWIDETAYVLRPAWA